MDKETPLKPRVDMMNGFVVEDVTKHFLLRMDFIKEISIVATVDRK